MSIWSQMFNALKGESDDFEENQKAVRIVDEELRIASLNLKDSKDALANLLAQRKSQDNKLVQTERDISEHESYAHAALEKNDESLALEIAEKIVELEVSLASQREQRSMLQEAILDTQSTIQHAERNVKRMKLQVETIKATESVQRAQAAVAKRHHGYETGTRSAQRALETLRQRQAGKAEELKTSKEFDSDNRRDELIQKLQDAGVISGSTEANEVLARIKNAKKGK